MTTQNTAPTRLRTKFALILGGIVLTLVLLELFLRLGGWLFLSIQEAKNQTSLAKNSEIRILCLGESTTALGGDTSYPRQLEHVLNSGQDQIKFSVINKGIPATTTTQIATHLEQYLETYKPQIVVAMIGVNDMPDQIFGDVQKPPFPGLDLLHDLRVYKMFKLLKTHLEHKALEREIKQSDDKMAGIEKKLALHPNSDDYNHLASFYRVGRMYDKEKTALLTAIALDPNNFEAHGYLGLNYKRSGDYDQAIPEFMAMLQLSPTKSELQIQAYSFLAETFRLNSQNAEAANIYRKALADLPERDIGALSGLAEIYLEQGKTKEAQTLLQRQLVISPSAALSYIKLSHCYVLQGQTLAAEKILRQGIAINPTAAVLYNELGSLLNENQKYPAAEQVLKKSLTLNTEDRGGDSKSIYINLSRSYQGQGRKAEAQNIQRFIDDAMADYSGETFRNYQKIRKAVSDRGIRLVAVQYPLRSIKPLKKMLQPAGQVVFVDNETVFQSAIAQKSYDHYFTDRFAGDFGHCSPAGNLLLAQNVAQAIRKIVTHY